MGALKRLSGLENIEKRGFHGSELSLSKEKSVSVQLYFSLPYPFKLMT